MVRVERRRPIRRYIGCSLCPTFHLSPFLVLEALVWQPTLCRCNLTAPHLSSNTYLMFCPKSIMQPKLGSLQHPSWHSCMPTLGSIWELMPHEGESQKISAPSSIPQMCNFLSGFNHLLGRFQLNQAPAAHSNNQLKSALFYWFPSLLFHSPSVAYNTELPA